MNVIRRGHHRRLAFPVSIRTSASLKVVFEKPSSTLKTSPPACTNGGCPPLFLDGLGRWRTRTKVLLDELVHHLEPYTPRRSRVRLRGIMRSQVRHVYWLSRSLSGDPTIARHSNGLPGHGTGRLTAGRGRYTLKLLSSLACRNSGRRVALMDAPVWRLVA